MAEEIPTATDHLNKLYASLTERYIGGLSNTSTAKFDKFYEYFSELLKINDVYAVAAASRPTNLQIRLTQGKQTTKHTQLGLGFLVASNATQANALSDSALVSVEKLLNEGRAGYDAVGIIVMYEGSLHFTRVIERHGSTLGARLQSHFPGLTVKALPAAVLSAATPVTSAATPASPTGAAAAAGNIEDMVDSLHQDLAAAGFRFDLGMLHRFCASLTTKRFAILTGLSGSGKTKLAEALALWLAVAPDRQCKVVAVGADWTSNQHVVGYPDALNGTAYESTPILTFIMDAAAPENASKPYFLVLDEMNLSHVERYFADFLSAIERNGQIELYAGQARPPVPAQLALPKNLFIVGTVNVDETTYMFSPKVLDRANVLEFRVNAADMSAVIESPPSADLDTIKSAGAPFADAFMAAQSAPSGLSPNQIVTARTDILKCFRIMEAARLQFGYRTASEILRFVDHHRRLAHGAWAVEDAVDAQVFQKVLPKLHGPRSSMEPLIWGLAYFAFHDIADADLDTKIIGPMLSRDPSLDPLALGNDGERLMEEDDARLPLAFGKLCRMAAKVKEGFVSFTEA